MEVLQYCNNTWIRCNELRKLHKLPCLIVNDKSFYEAKSYFKEKYNIEVQEVGLQSTDDHGVALVVYLANDIIDWTLLNSISDLFKVGVEEVCHDEYGHSSAYLKLYISIKQQMENV